MATLIFGLTSAGLTVAAAGAIAAVAYSRMSRRYVINEFGERQRIVFNLNGQESERASQTRRDARSEVFDLLQQGNLEADRVEPVFQHKLVDIRPYRRRYRIGEGDREAILVKEIMVPEQLTAHEVPLGEQNVKVSPELVAYAQKHTAFKKRTTALLQSTFNKVCRELNSADLPETEKVKIAITSTAKGFVPSPEEIVAMQHINSGASQQLIRFANNFVEEANVPFEPLHERGHMTWWQTLSASTWATSIWGFRDKWDRYVFRHFRRAHRSPQYSPL